MIDRNMILDQLAGLERQKRAAEDQIKAVEGAEQVCRHWLSQIDRLEAEAKKKQAEEEAAKNGHACLERANAGPPAGTTE